MAELMDTNRLTCTQCGGELHPDEGQHFITCPFCAATVFIDKAQVVFHWYLRPTLDATQAAAALARWMSGSQTVKDLDRKAQVQGYTFQYFPLWYFKTGGEDAPERIHLALAAASSVTELAHLNLPAGDLVRYDPSVDPQAVEPSVPLETARGWLKSPAGQPEIRETALVHVPIYIFKYTYKNETYTAVVEAATGSVIANIFPAKAEAPYLTAAGITAGIYLCLALLPLASGAFGLRGGLAGGIAIGVGLLAAPFLFAFAAWVASRV